MKTKVIILIFSILLFQYGIFNVKSNYDDYVKNPKDTVKMNLFIRSFFFIIIGGLLFVISLIKILKEVL